MDGIGIDVALLSSMCPRFQTFGIGRSVVNGLLVERRCSCVFPGFWVSGR